MNILLGVTGSVAATLTKKMVKALSALGNVQVVTTGWGKYFFEDELGVPVWYDNDEWYQRPNPSVAIRTGWTTDHIWIKKNDPVRHIDLRKWAGALVIAPLSANTMAKMANGICDNLLTSIYRAWDRGRPIICAPGMNTLMWEHPVTREHIDRLSNWGVQFVGPISKTLACNDEGMGAMAHIDDIVKALADRIRWRFPLDDCSGLPIGTHPGAFGIARRVSHHTGVDLYCRSGSLALAVEGGKILGWEKFTGPQDGSPWWLDTDAVLVEGPSGIICYGEIEVSPTIKSGDLKYVNPGDPVGTVKPVVHEGRERPDIPGHSRSMLHIELYERGRDKASTRWELGQPKHDYLMDPTPFLANAMDCPETRLEMP